MPIWMHTTCTRVVSTGKVLTTATKPGEINETNNMQLTSNKPFDCDFSCKIQCRSFIYYEYNVYSASMSTRKPFTKSISIFFPLYNVCVL